MQQRKGRSAPKKGVRATTSAVKTGSKKVAAGKKSGKAVTKLPANPHSWPQAMSASGAVAAHVVQESTRATRGMALDASKAMKIASVGAANGLHGRPADFATGLATAWMQPWLSGGKTGGMLGDAKTMRSAFDSQMQIYQALLKFSPLGIMMQSQAMVTDMMMSIIKTGKTSKPPARVAKA